MAARRDKRTALGKTLRDYRSGGWVGWGLLQFDVLFSASEGIHHHSLLQPAWNSLRGFFLRLLFRIPDKIAQFILDLKSSSALVDDFYLESLGRVVIAFFDGVLARLVRALLSVTMLLALDDSKLADLYLPL